MIFKLSSDRQAQLVGFLISVALIAGAVPARLPDLRAPLRATGIPTTIKLARIVPKRQSRKAEVAIKSELAHSRAPAKEAQAETSQAKGVLESEHPGKDTEKQSQIPLVEEKAANSPEILAPQNPIARESTKANNVDLSVLPPAPGNDYVPELSSDELPGGDVLVLGVLLDSEGHVLDAKIVTPSKNPLNDLSYFIATKDTVITKVDPPIAPGTTRWITLKLHYTQDQNPLLP